MLSLNNEYIMKESYSGNISSEIRKVTSKEGQHPKAIVITCSDSRVIPEIILQAGIGELFVIRVAGNVIDQTEIASIEYAVQHLKVKDIILLGHTQCGAIQATIHGEFDGNAGVITRRIKKAIGNETNPLRACRMNVKSGVMEIRNIFGSDVHVVGAIYDIETGRIQFEEFM